MMGRIPSKKCNRFEAQKLKPHYFVTVTCLGFSWVSFTHLMYVRGLPLCLDSQLLSKLAAGGTLWNGKYLSSVSQNHYPDAKVQCSRAI